LTQLSIVNFKKDTYLVVEGHAATDKFFIVQKGRVISYKDTDIPDSTADVLGPGDFVGVISCMSGQSQIETAVAYTEVTAISVAKDQYAELIRNNTPVALKIIRNFANRLRSLNEMMTLITSDSSGAVSSEGIYNVAEYYFNTSQFNLASYGFYHYLKAYPEGKNAELAKQRFEALKEKTEAIEFEPPKETLRAYPKDTMIFSEYQIGNEMFIIKEGLVKITKVTNGNEVILAVLKKGDFFGEMALLESKPRSASAIAFEDCALMTVTRDNFDQLVKTESQLITRLTVTLSERLWSMHRNLLNTQLADPAKRLLDMLAIQIEKAKVPLTPNSAYQFDITPYDLASMCGIPKDEQAQHMLSFSRDPRIKIVDGKIHVSDCAGLVKMTEFFHKYSKKGKK
jgi:CRP-like cAMP-binding protein